MAACKKVFMRSLLCSIRSLVSEMGSMRLNTLNSPMLRSFTNVVYVGSKHRSSLLCCRLATVIRSPPNCVRGVHHATGTGNLQGRSSGVLRAVAAVGAVTFGSWWMHRESRCDTRHTETIDHSKGVKSSQNSDLQLSLYQYVTCPFCCKVRAYLDYSGIPYDIIEVNPVLRQQIKFSKYKKVPIVLVKNGENEPIQINDSSVIISTLASYFMDPKQGLENIKSYYSPVVYTSSSGKDVSEVPNKYYLMYLDDAKRTKSDDEIEEERKWRQWADDVLVHMLSPNIYRTRQEAMQAFNYFSEVGKWEEKFPAWERYLVIYVGAIAMYFVGKRLKSRHNLRDDVRESLYDACRQWMNAVGKKPFLGGEKPNLADLAVYGSLSSIEGCEAFQDLLKNTKTGSWYYRVKRAVESHTGKQ